MIHLVILLAGLGLLYLGAEATVRGARGFGLRMGLSPLVVGLTIVAYGTSMPELVVSTTATLQGEDAIALANVVGSNICNVLLILGLGALIRPMQVRTRVLRVEAPIVVVLSLAIFALLRWGELGRPAGVVLVLGIVGYTIWTLRLAEADPAEITADSGAPTPAADGRAWLDLLWVGAGLLGLFGGASLFVRGAVDGATALGVPPAVVGLTVVAIGTSAPELATSVLAAIRGEGDIAIGNVVGSNVFNLSGVLGVAAIADPIGGSGVGLLDLIVMVASAAALLLFLYTGRRLERWEGALMLGAYLLYLSTLEV